MQKDSKEYAHFCQIPKDEQENLKFKKDWCTFLGRFFMSSAVRFVKKPHEVTRQDWFRVVGTVRGNVALLTIMHTLRLDIDAKHRIINLLREAIQVSVPNAILVWSLSEVLFTQIFKGEVTLVSDENVIIRFKIGDDLVERRFTLADKISDRSIEEGQTVQASCVLEFVAPTTPMTDEEIERYAAQYDDFEKYIERYLDEKR